MAFGESWVGRDVPVAAKGRATLTTGDESRYREVQTYYSPELRPTGRARNEQDEATVRKWRDMARAAQNEREPAPTLHSELGSEGEPHIGPGSELEVGAEPPRETPVEVEVRETPQVPPPAEPADTRNDGSGCSEPDCHRKVKARGMCNVHYQRARRAEKKGTTTDG